MRLQLPGEHHGVFVLDDAYNANAESMLAAFETLRELPCKGRRVAVLGDMAELGAQSEAAHRGSGAAGGGVGHRATLCGRQDGAVAARGARGAGLNRVLEFADVEEAGWP